MSFELIKAKIDDSSKIGITFHCSPDGDAIGSTLGLLNGLREIGKNVYVISKEGVPDNLSFLPLSEEITGEVTEPTKDTDLVIVLDCGNVDRICADLSNYEGDIINIDHHVTNEKFGVINHIESDSAATAEMIYILLKLFNIDFVENNRVNVNIGTCIYTSLVTDTGSFRHSNVTKRTHEIAGNLIACGVNNTRIYNCLFDNKQVDKVRLVGEALSSVELVLNNKVSFIAISQELLKKHNLESIDTAEVIGMALGIADVEASVVIKEVEDGVKASLRSKANFDVRKVAENLGGGGHVKAAGLKLKDVTLMEAKNKILKEIEKEL